MDVSQYDPQAVANAEALILHEQDLGKSRRDAVRFLIDVKARVIADEAVHGVSPWPQRADEYRYLRDLPWDGGVAPDLASHEVTA